MQLYNKEDSHGVHTHTKSHISGILYLCDKGTSTTFMIESLILMKIM